MDYGIKTQEEKLTLIFLFDDFLCKIAILEPLKVRFLDKKQKLLSDDGSFLKAFEFLKSI